MITQRVKPERDADLVASIVEELEKGGALKDPRHPEERRTSLAGHVRHEVQRSLNRMRLLQSYKWPDGAPKVTEADVKKAVTVLRSIAWTEEQRAVLDQFDAVRQYPPEGVNALKYRCAAEAFDLMTFFSVKPPTGTEAGPFRNIAALLFEAVTGQPHTDVDMKRSTDRVRTDRLKYHPQAFLRQG
jgi:hypothetical protein